MTNTERREYQASLKIAHWTQKGKSLHDMAPGIKPSRDAENAAWLWLRKIEADTGETLNPLAFLRRREALALIIEIEAIRNAVCRRSKEITKAQRTAARKELLKLCRQITGCNTDWLDIVNTARAITVKYADGKKQKRKQS